MSNSNVPPSDRALIERLVSDVSGLRTTTERLANEVQRVSSGVDNAQRTSARALETANEAKRVADDATRQISTTYDAIKLHTKRLDESIGILKAETLERAANLNESISQLRRDNESLRQETVTQTATLAEIVEAEKVRTAISDERNRTMLAVQRSVAELVESDLARAQVAEERKAAIATISKAVEALSDAEKQRAQREYKEDVLRERDEKDRAEKEKQTDARWRRAQILVGFVVIVLGALGWIFKTWIAGEIERATQKGKQSRVEATCEVFRA